MYAARFARLSGAAVTALLVISAAPAQPQPWPQPDATRLAPGALKDSVLYGRKLFTETYAVVGPEIAETQKRYSGNNLSCQSCHLNGGAQRYALPLIGVYGVFPTYIAREDEVRTLEERINGCFERSMNGRALPVNGKEMKALLAYVQFLSTDVPTGSAPQGRGSPALPLLSRPAEPQRGAGVYARNCAACHGADGLGQRKGKVGDAGGYVFPPLWGPDSFNDGAGMHRLIASASFVHANMPLGVSYEAPALPVEDAWDVAAYINSKPRPHYAARETDYPTLARKPVDAPFPPYADRFSAEQHRLGPFQPLLDDQKKAIEQLR